ncbi:sporulation transcription regulator whiA [Syntrophobotulus glycolicus DSM 8271]|uniref:Probable cell division protein WhiA n=1 Tax=Syntrophobotulus glycolicus (strain DSM 8271 / FlGlyR) TaxID=645991 RepID=F0T1Q6_SYNGF|nr:DNA-binding protein WhiA [Syntrophobotulus glycolicus]ADY57480.1 sporulation transcription regulator whiA [Syntrophobotulus glycolicus DSM 8271]
MSFSTSTKEELARLEEKKKCCELAELSALIRMDGTLQISSNQQYSLNVTTESAPVARKIYNMARNLLELPASIVVRRKLRLKKNNSYMVRIYPRGGQDLQKLGLLNHEGEILAGIHKDIIRHRCDQKAYLRGAFLAGGSISNPEGGNYHLEIITNDQVLAEDISKLLNKFDLGAKISNRKNFHVVYLKESEHIFEFLALIGAHQALFDFENVRIIKDMRNQVNRIVNCETANLNKTVDAAVRQLENIKLIQQTIGLKALPQNLREVANLRLQYPDSSLKELGEMLVPKVGKSGINHRLRKIDEIAEKITKTK